MSLSNFAQGLAAGLVYEHWKAGLLSDDALRRVLLDALKRDACRQQALGLLPELQSDPASEALLGVDPVRHRKGFSNPISTPVLSQQRFATS